MISYKVFAILGFLLVSITFVIQSAPIEKVKETAVESSSTNDKQAIDQSVVKSEDSEKKKRFIEDDLLNEYYDSNTDDDDENNVQLKNEHILHTKIQETPVQIHDNADRPVNTDDSKVFSDINMSPNELTNVIRRRRNVKLNDQLNQRRKRALSPYDIYNTESFYDPYADLIEQQEYDRPIRSFAPIYWYPSGYEHRIRSALAPSFHESSQWPRVYANGINDDNDLVNDWIYNDNDIDDDDEYNYDSNHYPILLKSLNNPFNNYELQQQYNTDDLPIDENRFDNNDESLEMFNDDDDDDDETYQSYYPSKRLNYPWVF